MRTIDKKFQEKFETFRLGFVGGVEFAAAGSHVNKNEIYSQIPAFFFQKFKKRPSVWPRGSNNQILKEFCTLGSKIIATRTDDGQMSIS